MIVHSTPSRLHYSNLLFNNDESIGTNYNYNKSATIPRSESSSLIGKMVTSEATVVAPQQQKQPTRRSTTFRSCKRVSVGGPSHRAIAQRDHQRSLRYTRTLDVIPEDDSGSSPTPTTDFPSHTTGSANGSSNTIIVTDFWHSQRSMKKSATAVSLESLLTGSRDDRNPPMTEETRSSRDNGFFVVEDDCDDDYDNFLADWDL